jgi:(E)-4-hydroxy-3-methylbut-2-enyl-diphosphate synthase
LTAIFFKKISHLSGIKIAVMGCVVNGIGEMNGADFGYVGTGPGRVNLYHRGRCVKTNIPEQSAVEERLRLIESCKEN